MNENILEKNVDSSWRQSSRRYCISHLISKR